MKPETVVDAETKSMDPQTVAFLRAVEIQCENLTVSPGLARESCSTCEDLEPDDIGEEEFSVSDCDSCRSSLSGGRSVAHGMGPEGDNNVYHVLYCVDCVMFHANGDLPESWRARAGEESES